MDNSFSDVTDPAPIWCFLCCARLHRHGHGHHGMRPLLVRAWCQIFNLPRLPSPWLEKLLGGAGGGTEPGVGVTCETCTEIMEDVASCWIQLNEIYSRIGTLRNKIEDTLKTATEEEPKADGVEESMRRYKFLKALQTAERFEVDQEALAVSHDDHNQLKEHEPTRVSMSTSTFEKNDNENNQVDREQAQDLPSIHIKDEPEDPAPDHEQNQGHNDEDDQKWIPSPPPSPLAADVDSDGDNADNRMREKQLHKPRRRRPRIPKSRPLSPTTVSNLVDEIHNGRRQLYVPLKHVRWDSYSIHIKKDKTAQKTKNSHKRM